jgi:phosphatidylglycerol:prolipoprotein diacylglycerol transferase
VHPLIPYFDPPVLHIHLGRAPAVPPPGSATVWHVYAPFLEGILPVKEIPIHAFGVLVALGFLVGSRIAMDRAKRIGLDPEQINKLVGYLVFGTFVGGHIVGGFMYNPMGFINDPRSMLYVWQDLSSWGGFLVCVPLSVWFFRSQKLALWPYLDCLAIGLGMGWFLGRMGCFVAHDHPGPPTQFFLGVYGMCDTHQRDVACHDMGLYEALWSLVTFGVFLALDRAPRVPGFYAYTLGLLYTPIRFAMEFARPITTDERYFGLTPAQYCCVAFFLLCAYGLSNRLRSNEAPVWAPPSGAPPAPPAA